MASKPKWRYSEGYWYYEDDQGGYGYVHAASGGGYLAACTLAQCVTKTVKEGKDFVEKAFHRKR